jgi:beta-lactamase regulating signal transducer with metallopeptidase domain
MSFPANSAVAALMGFSANLYSIASTAAERLLFSLGLGTLLALVVWLLLRVFPKKDSRTSFAVWFATLLITAALPVLSLYSASMGKGAAPQAVITVSASWAVYIFLAWAAAACLGLARVAVALWQVRKLRREAEMLDAQGLGPELRDLVEQFRRSRAVELLVSRRLEVPTAVGFFRPGVVLPEWLLQETPAEELKYILLHELAHLRRRDDWTNLAQQVVKALLFFLPSVWWIERKLALDREMACDDAVLEQSGTPQGYAECLAHVAERSFLRRQLALAQAAVSKLRQLTVRVSRILDPNRQQQTRIWKPAIPAVMVAAGLCAFSASQAPSLIGFAEGEPGIAVQRPAGQDTQQSSLRWPVLRAGKPALQSAISQPAGKPVLQPATMAQQPGLPLKAVSANLKERATMDEGNKPRAWNAAFKLDHHAPRKSHGRKRVPYALSNLRAAADRIQSERMTMAGLHPAEAQPEYVTVREEFVMVVAQRMDSPPENWQMHVIEISVTQAKPQKPAPKKI